MTTAAPVLTLPGQPQDADGPVFREPWEAEAFALAVRLSEHGLFAWREWARAYRNTPHGRPVALSAADPTEP